MTAQNLDVYETFRVRRVSSICHSQFSNLVIGRGEEQRLFQGERSPRYLIDFVSTKLLLCELRPALNAVFSSIGLGTAAYSLPLESLQKRLARCR